MQREENGSLRSPETYPGFRNSAFFPNILEENNEMMCPNGIVKMDHNLEVSESINSDVVKTLINIQNINAKHIMDDSTLTTLGLTSCHTCEGSKPNLGIPSEEDLSMSISPKYRDGPLPPPLDSAARPSQLSFSTDNVYSAIMRPPLCAKPLFFRTFLHQKPVPERILAEEAAGVFVGQLPSTYSANDIKALLRAIGNEQGQIVYVHDVKCHNRERTCAFVRINAGALQAILSFTKRILCDVNCVWVVAPSQVSQLPLFIQEIPRELLRCVPKVPLVLEKITQQAKFKHRVGNPYPLPGDPPGFLAKPAGPFPHGLATVLAPPPPPAVALPTLAVPPFAPPFFLPRGFPDGVEKTALPPPLPCGVDPFQSSFGSQTSHPFFGSAITGDASGGLPASFSMPTIVWVGAGNPASPAALPHSLLVKDGGVVEAAPHSVGVNPPAVDPTYAYLCVGNDAAGSGSGRGGGGGGVYWTPVNGNFLAHPPSLIANPVREDCLNPPPPVQAGNGGQMGVNLGVNAAA